jgi:hypothetical protein
MFDELGLEVYETIGSMPVETAGEVATRDNRRTEAILIFVLSRSSYGGSFMVYTS